MSKINIKPALLIMACLCIFMTASCAFASDITDMNNMTSIADADSNDPLEISANQVEEDKLSQSNIGTFKELNKDIKNLSSGDIYYFDKDYTFDEKTDKSSKIIDISADNVKIEGKNHIIDASGVNGAMFRVTGNNVLIKDLTFTNFTAKSENNVLTSPISWTGNNGKIYNSGFLDNTGVNGGGICWTGDNGLIKYCYFENNTASLRGGAIFIGAENTKIIGATIINFTSSENEAIYLTNKNSKPTTLYIEKSYFENDKKIDGINKVACDRGCQVMFDCIDINTGNYDELCNDLENLKSGEYYNIINDYAIVGPKGDLSRNRIINIKADNIVINGNGHKIDGKGAKNFFAIFNITGNNVTITNLQIIDSSATNYEYSISNMNIYENNYNRLTSPIEWNGNNGVISNCTFNYNTGVKGGAINWNVNNGIIENCIFNNNAATFGGSVYIKGTNNIIRNCIFKDSYSTYHYESIYLTDDIKPKSDLNGLLIVNNCTFENENYNGLDVYTDEGCTVLINGVDPKTVLEPANIKELIEDLKDLKDNDVYNLNRDYFLKVDVGLIIQINANNVTINGNGHTISGQDPLSAIFYVHGNDVKISNLIIDFSSENYEADSLIKWAGDNGSITNCTLTGNLAQQGGALFWSGNNGIINNCLFTDNIATFGGAIYITGTNSTVSDCTFRNSAAQTTNEAIYYKNRNGLFTITNCNFDCVKIWIDGDSDVIIDGKIVPKTFLELRDEILNLTENEFYDIYRDYQFIPTMGLTLTTNNITINGNKHIIYANGRLESSVFNVVGNSISINGLNFNNSNNEIGESFITWRGDNGIFTNSALIGNVAENGGAILWTGNNGLINDCLFIKNTAILGGAIYVDGSNNKISNSYFIQTGSRLSSESIYINPDRKKLTLENIFFDELSGGFIDGKKIKIDMKNVFEESFESQLAGEHININPLIYISITKGGVNYYNDNIYYYSSYYNETGDYIFTLTKEFEEYAIVYSKEYHIKNIFNDNFNEVYTALYNGNYENRFTIAKNEIVSSASDYTNVLTNIFYSLSVFGPINGFLNDDKSHSVIKGDNIAYQLNVKFTKSLIIECDSTWDLSASPYTAVCIDGKGSVIKGSFEDREEDKWVSINEKELNQNLIFFASNIKIEGFNTAVENFGGHCIFNNVHFHNNKMDYILERDWGAAIINTGIVTCINCTFTNNYAKNGGAIFSQGLLALENCSFSENTGYGVGNDICVGDGGKVSIDGVEITDNNQHSAVYFAESMSLVESTALTVGTLALSFVIGAVVGFITFNPAIGIGVGVLVGGALGVGASAIIIKNTYDANFNRLTTVLTLSIGSAFAGGMGGFMGYYEANQFYLNRGRHLYLYDCFWGASTYFHWGEAALRVCVAFGVTIIVGGAIYVTERCVLD